jgi:hypothetical protein
MIPKHQSSPAPGKKSRRVAGGFLGGTTSLSYDMHKTIANKMIGLNREMNLPVNIEGVRG